MVTLNFVEAIVFIGAIVAIIVAMIVITCLVILDIFLPDNTVKNGIPKVCYTVLIIGALVLSFDTAYLLVKWALFPSPAPIYQVETGIDGETSNARLGIKNLIPIDERDEKDIHGTDKLYYDPETGIVYFGDKYSPSAYYSPNGKPYKYDPDRKLFTESD